jgi:hypothetical protein
MLNRIVLSSILATFGSVFLAEEARCTPTTVTVPAGSPAVQGPSAGAAIGFGSGFGAAGDVNGDGITDFFVGSGGGGGCSPSPCTAKTYVVFGASVARNVDLANLGSNGYMIQGPSAALGSFYVDAIGDVSGDALADLVVSQLFGTTFVVFGKADTATINTASLGSAGFEISGGTYRAYFRGVPDLDGDGIRELFIVGHTTVRAYLVRGKSSSTAVNLDSLGGAGVTITAPDNLDNGAYTGDVNGDGNPDFIVAHRNTAWVVFGDGTLSDVTVASAPGFSITGMPIVPLGYGGAVVSALGDVNGDGKADVGVAHPNSGQAWVVYGRTATTPIDVTSLGTAGYSVVSTSDRQAAFIPLGDINSDGESDYAYQGGDDYTAVVFGQPTQQSFASADIDGIGARVIGTNLAARNDDFIQGAQLLTSISSASPLGRTGAGVIEGVTLPGPNFTVASSLVYTQNSVIAPVSPGGATYAGPVSYSVSPSLPRGMSLNTTTGVLSGTPLDVQSSSSYSVMATDELGARNRTVSIRIDPDAYSVVSPNSGAETDSHPELTWQRASATDNTEPVSSYSVLVGGAAVGTLSASSCGATTCTLKVGTPVLDGARTWSVSTIDRAGRTRSSSTGSFVVADPPRVVFTASAATIATGETLLLDASSSRDENGQVASFAFDLGTGAFGAPSTAATSSVIFDTPGQYTVRVRVTDDAGLSSESQLSVKVTLASRSGEVGLSINDGAVATNDPNVTLSVRWPYLAETMLVSNDGGFGSAGGAVSLPVAAETAWTLRTSGPERSTMIVYARFSGGTSGRETYTDDIILDQRAPTVQSASAQGGSVGASVSGARAGKRRSIKVQAADENSGIEFVEVSAMGSSTTLVRQRVNRKGSVGKKKVTSTVSVTAAPRARLRVRVFDVAGNPSKWKAVK